MPRNPVCFALDVPTVSEASRLVDLLSPHVGAFKVGLELFVASHREGWWPDVVNDVVLDLKLHDIPETVGRAVKAGGELGARFMTIHIQQRKALEIAVKEAEPYGIQILCVTLLTSMGNPDLMDLDFDISMTHDAPAERVARMAKFARTCGVSGFVCSPKEVASLKAERPEDFYLVPGVRPDMADAGDQVRVGTPAQAVADGANLIVVGRPIRDAPDPVRAAQEIVAEAAGSRR